MVTNIKKERNPYRTGMDDNHSYRGFLSHFLYFNIQIKKFSIKKKF